MMVMIAKIIYYKIDLDHKIEFRSVILKNNINKKYQDIVIKDANRRTDQIR